MADETAMDMTPPHTERSYWTGALWGPFMARLFKLANGGDAVARDYAATLLREQQRDIDVVGWLIAQERDNRFSWRLLKRRIKALDSTGEP